MASDISDLNTVSTGFLRELSAVESWARWAGETRIAVLAAMLSRELAGELEEAQPASRMRASPAPGNHADALSRNAGMSSTMKAMSVGDGWYSLPRKGDRFGKQRAFVSGRQVLMWFVFAGFRTRYVIGVLHGCFGLGARASTRMTEEGHSETCVPALALSVCALALIAGRGHGIGHRVRRRAGVIGKWGSGRASECFALRRQGKPLAFLSPFREGRVHPAFGRKRASKIVDEFAVFASLHRQFTPTLINIAADANFEQTGLAKRKEIDFQPLRFLPKPSDFHADGSFIEASLRGFRIDLANVVGEGVLLGLEPQHTVDEGFDRAAAVHGYAASVGEGVSRGTGDNFSGEMPVSRLMRSARGSDGVTLPPLILVIMERSQLTFRASETSLME
jgi:hypothetical protein